MFYVHSVEDRAVCQAQWSSRCMCSITMLAKGKRHEPCFSMASNCHTGWAKLLKSLQLLSPWLQTVAWCQQTPLHRICWSFEQLFQYLHNFTSKYNFLIQAWPQLVRFGYSKGCVVFSQNSNFCRNNDILIFLLSQTVVHTIYCLCFLRDCPKLSPYLFVTMHTTQRFNVSSRRGQLLVHHYSQSTAFYGRRMNTTLHLIGYTFNAAGDPQEACIIRCLRTHVCNFLLPPQCYPMPSMTMPIFCNHCVMLGWVDFS